MADNSGQTVWTYDPQGRPTSRQQIMVGFSTLTNYGYDSYGRPSSITFPSGHVIQYGYTNGKITSITLNGSTTVLSNVLYQPFGPIKGWTWGNSTTTSRTFDQDTKITAISSAGSKSYSFDDAFRITGVTDASNSALSQTLGYDSLDRLTSASRTGLSQTWTYDANGNRLTEGGTAASTFTNSSTSNRLSSVSGAITKSYLYDNAGNTLSDGTSTFTYDQRGRMLTATKSSVTTTYSYNALGQRVKKSNSGSTSYFVYDEAGHLLGEYTGAGVPIQEIVWLGDVPVASIRANESGSGVGVFYIHTDHLNTPRKITRPTDNAVVWRWDSDPFGNGAPNEDPDGNSLYVAFNLRFPGQYFDSEAGNHYNYFRDYDPSTGRYVESDPVGLVGGVNTYAYALASPISQYDPKGLSVQGAAVIVGAAVMTYCRVNPQACATAAAAAALAIWQAMHPPAAMPAFDPVIDPDKPIPPQLPGYIDPSSTIPTTESEPCPPLKKPPSDKEQCINAVQLEFEACKILSGNPIACQAKRAFGLLMCGLNIHGDGSDGGGE